MKEKEQQEIKRTLNSSFISLHLWSSGLVPLGHLLQVSSLVPLTPLHPNLQQTKRLFFFHYILKNNFIDYFLYVSHSPKQSEN
jgi:hypothetical protein